MPQRKKIKPESTMKLKTYTVVSIAVENGITMGFNRAHKHMETPTSTDICEAVLEAVLTAVMGELCDIIDFGD